MLRIIFRILKSLFKGAFLVGIMYLASLCVSCGTTKQCAVFTGEGRITYVMGNENFPTEKIPSVKLPNSENM